MVVEFNEVDCSIVRWSKNGKTNWKIANIDDLIHVYESVEKIENLKHDIEILSNLRSKYIKTLNDSVESGEWEKEIISDLNCKTVMEK